MNDFSLTIGQYINGDSWIHKLDPRFKIISVIILMISIFLLPSINYMLISLIVIIVILLSSRLPILYILKGLKPIIFISIFSFILQIVYTDTGELLHNFIIQFSYYHIGIIIGLIVIYLLTSKYIYFKLIYLLIFVILIISTLLFLNFNNGLITTFNVSVYNEGLINGGFFVTRIIVIVMITTILTLTTSTIDLNMGLESVLKPFKYIGIPVSEISLMISLTLRFVPTLLLETNKILKAQASRGVDFTEGNLIQKIKQIITLLIPMFVVSFKRADDLACAMESRGYVIGNKRTNLDVLKFKYKDYIGFFVVFSILVCAILLKVL